MRGTHSRRGRVTGWCGLAAALVCGIASPGRAALQSLGQHGELLTRGTITAADGAVWDVRFIPGTRRINRNAAEGWRDAGSSLAELWGRELWAEGVPDSFVDGVEYSRDVVTDHFAEGISHDVRKAVARTRELRTGDFGRSFLVAWTWTATTGKVLGRTLWLPIGTAGGATYALTAPVCHVVWRPTKSVGHAVFRGALAPVASHAWNETAWTLTLLSPVPERETRWVRRAQPSRELVIDAERLDAFVQAGVQEYVTNEELAAAREQLSEARERMNALQQGVGQLESELRDDASVRARDEVIRRAAGAAEIRLDADAEARLRGEDELSAAIARALAERGRTASETDVRAIREAVVGDVETVLRSR